MNSGPYAYYPGTQALDPCFQPTFKSLVNFKLFFEYGHGKFLIPFFLYISNFLNCILFQLCILGTFLQKPLDYNGIKSFLGFLFYSLGLCATFYASPLLGAIVLQYILKLYIVELNFSSVLKYKQKENKEF
jgi:hypothetical protein